MADSSYVDEEDAGVSEHRMKRNRKDIETAIDEGEECKWKGDIRCKAAYVEKEGEDAGEECKPRGGFCKEAQAAIRYFDHFFPLQNSSDEKEGEDEGDKDDTEQDIDVGKEGEDAGEERKQRGGFRKEVEAAIRYFDRFFPLQSSSDEGKEDDNEEDIGHELYCNEDNNDNNLVNSPTKSLSDLGSIPSCDVEDIDGDFHVGGNLSQKRAGTHIENETSIQYNLFLLLPRLHREQIRLESWRIVSNIRKCDRCDKCDPPRLWRCNECSLLKHSSPKLCDECIVYNHINMPHCMDVLL